MFRFLHQLPVPARVPAQWSCLCTGDKNPKPVLMEHSSNHMQKHPSFAQSHEFSHGLAMALHLCLFQQCPGQTCHKTLSNLGLNNARSIFNGFSHLDCSVMSYHTIYKLSLRLHTKNAFSGQNRSCSKVVRSFFMSTILQAANQFPNLKSCQAIPLIPLRLDPNSQAPMPPVLKSKNPGRTKCVSPVGARRRD